MNSSYWRTARNLLLSILLADLGTALFAQTSGRISGQILDQSQASIPDAKVTAENTATDSRREVQSDRQGRYVFADLPIGTYKVSVEAKGFQSQVRSGLEVNVASTFVVDFTLPTGQVNVAVEVKSTAEVIDPNAANGQLMDNKSVVDLPINGRDYARFTLLTPGAVAVYNYIADTTFNGMHSVHNQFSIDGVDASRVDEPYMANGFERGARLLTGSLDTVEEFRVQTSNYNAEYGRAAGSDVRIVTKSGGNRLHGTAFDFLRNDFFDARNFFNTKPNHMPEFRYNNFGGNLSGPIWKDRTFYFANYEGSRQLVGITGSGTVPSALMRTEVAATSPQLVPLLNMFPIGQTPSSNPLVSNYVTTGVSNVREDTGSIKVDHNFTSKDHVFLRFNLNDSYVHGPLFGVSTNKLGVDDYQDVPITTTNAAFHYDRVMSPRIVNEFLAGVQRWGSQLNSELPLPTVNITGLTVDPGNGGFSRTNSTMYQYGDTVSWVHGAHTIKFGATGWKSQVNALSHPSYSLTYTSLQNFINNSLYQSTFSGGNPGSGLRQAWIGSFVQDTWQVQPGLTVDIGLRYDLGIPNYDVQGKAQPFDLSTFSLGPPGQQFFPMNKKNFSPRVGIAWQATPTTVIRTGYGIFYQQYPPGLGSGVVTNTVPGNFSLLQQNIPTLSYPVTPFVTQGTPPVPAYTAFNQHHPDWYAQQWSFTVKQALPQHMELTVAYVGNHAVNLRVQRYMNLLDPTLGRRPYPQYGNITVENDDGQSVYHGLQVGLNRRFSSGLILNFNYTYSKSIDDVQDYGLYSTLPQNQNCQSCERGPGTNDIRHNATFSALYNLPFGSGHHIFGNATGFGSLMATGWQINGLGLIRSGIADLPLIGVNTYGNADTTNQRPNVVAGVSTIPANQTINQFWNPAAFSIPAAGTFGNAARGTLYGPSAWDADVSLLKDTAINERVRLEFRAEVFNIFNHPTFALPYNVVGTSSFGQILSTFGATLGFGVSRQIQLALKLKF
jgi:Carboxypeptidase regulatory-like domain/TonB dependent receptor